MPTGYTSLIEDNENTTFEEYLWRCVRAFDYCIHLRDRPLDLKLTPEILAERTSSYCQKRFLETQEEYYKWYSMSDTEKHDWAKAEIEKEVTAVTKYRDYALVKWNRYQKMREQVLAWTPPSTEYDCLKSFMISQIDLCASPARKPTPYYDERLKSLGETTSEQRVKQHTMELLRDLSSYATEVGEFEKSEAEGRKWLSDLMKAVPIPT